MLDQRLPQIVSKEESYFKNVNWFQMTPAGICTALQSQKAVTTYLESKQLLPFGFDCSRVARGSVSLLYV